MAYQTYDRDTRYHPDCFLYGCQMWGGAPGGCAQPEALPRAGARGVCALLELHMRASAQVAHQTNQTTTDTDPD